jgi:hypothetical protein
VLSVRYQGQGVEENLGRGRRRLNIYFLKWFQDILGQGGEGERGEGEVGIEPAIHLLKALPG